MEKRPAEFSGLFYPSERLLIEEFASSVKREEKIKSIACIVPHAGWVFSGALAFRTLSSIEGSDKTFVILGTGHSGRGGISVSARDWETPLGTVGCDTDMAERIAGRLGIRPSERGHTGEHSIEVQLPLMQMLFGRFRFVAISAGHGCFNDYRKMAEAIPEDAYVVASSDLTHYGRQYGYAPEGGPEKAKENDMRIIGLIQNLETEKMIRFLERTGSAVCGPGAIAAAMKFAKMRGAERGELIGYENSFDKTGDGSAAVGYAGIALI